MTTEKEPRAVLRRGRLIATAGVGAAVCVAGLIAAVPASAVTPVAPTATLTLPTQFSNNSTGAPSSQAVSFEVKSNDATNDNASVQYQLQLTVPAGVSCGNVVLSAPTGTGADANPFTAGAATGTAPNCTFVTGTETLTHAADDNWSVDIAITAPAGAFTPAPTGDIAGTFSVNYNGVSSLVNATGTSKLVSPGAASFNTPFTAPKFGSIYNFALVKDAGFPATGSTGYTAEGVLNPVNASQSAADVSRNTPIQVTTGSGATLANDYYISLNDATPATQAVGGDETGFYFDTTSGSVVFGKLHVVAGAQTSNTFTPTVVSVRGQAMKYTWIIVANNGSGGATAGDSAGLAKLTLGAHDVASPSILLNVAFTDVSATNPFAADINTLSGAGIVQGYGDGSFGITNPVSRQAFASFATKMLNLYLSENPTASIGQYHAGVAGPPAVTANLIPTGVCTTTNPSAFKDVANSNPFCQQIAALVGLGIVQGYAGNTFHPAASISRQAIAAFLYRMNSAALNLAVSDATPAATTFTDVTAANKFSGDIKWMATNNITTGTKQADGTFKFLPTIATSRQANAAFLVRWGNLYGLFS